MPRYFFHVQDGYSSPDRDGSELPDVYTAQAQAIRMSGELLRDMGGKFWDGTEWKLEVADEGGRTLFVLRFSADELPAMTDAQPPSAVSTGLAPLRRSDGRDADSSG